MAQTQRFEFGFLSSPQVRADKTLARNWRQVDARLHVVLEDRDLSTPPAVTGGDAGKSWQPKATATGKWEGQEMRIATVDENGEWEFRTFRRGEWVYIVDEAVWMKYDGTQLIAW